MNRNSDSTSPQPLASEERGPSLDAPGRFMGSLRELGFGESSPRPSPKGERENVPQPVGEPKLFETSTTSATFSLSSGERAGGRGFCSGCASSPCQLATPILLHLYTSPGHNFFGHHGQPAGREPMLELSSIECVAGRGIRGDRFFDYKENYKGQITFFAYEVYERLCEQLLVCDHSPSVFRRNVITRGLELNALMGEDFELQGIHFRGVEECKPCGWMDQAFAPGAEARLRGCGGLRATILSNGTLHSARHVAYTSLTP